jgi:hypothetical protein
VNYSAVIPINCVRHPVDLDPGIQSLNHGYQVETPAEDGEPIFKLTERVDKGLDA